MRHGHEPPRGQPGRHAHESPPIMTWPLIALAIPTIVIGWPWIILPFAEPVLEQMLAYGQPIRAIELGSAHWLAMGASILSPPRGSAWAVGYYVPRWRLLRPASTPCQRFGGALRLPGPQVVLRRALSTPSSSGRPWRWPAWRAEFDRRVIDGVVNGSACLTVLLSRLEGVFDRSGVDWAGQCWSPGSSTSPATGAAASRPAGSATT